MIRRDVTLPDGQPGWLRISQVDHARLSAELASRWGAGQFSPVICSPYDGDANPLHGVRNEVLAAICHHDDGWLPWEAAPSIDPDQARLPSFLEMQLPAAIDIWQRSVLAAENIGLLAAWVVAGHFLAFREEADSRDQPVSRSWQVNTTGRRREWLAQWQGLCPERHTRQLADQALSWLQWFDRLSLWLSLGRPGEYILGKDPLKNLRRNQTARFVLVDTDAAAENHLVEVSPWPFLVPELVLSVPGSRVPQDMYTSGEQWLSASVSSGQNWRLVPAKA